MCGRKTLTKGKMEIIEELSIQLWDDSFDHQPNYNIAPTQTVPILVHDGQRIVKPMQWGLIPKWAKDPKKLPMFINARSETLTEKRSFLNLIGTNRCIVITDGYYEWRKTSTVKQPYYITKPDRSILPMAGLWSQWADNQGVPVFTYTVITSAASRQLEFIHHRMPAIIEKENINIWLDCDTNDSGSALNLLQPLQKGLEAYPVSNFVNNVRNNTPHCIVKVNELPATLFK
ncbi:MAG: SOS response-associated peptidase [Candidatus Marinimicrobia bacterium]|nr:SOS response-associated peptidase [Candidatus Neomarinimicrobiota bacterium]